jgi:hypothetical protein
VPSESARHPHVPIRCGRCEEGRRHLELDHVGGGDGGDGARGNLGHVDGVVSSESTAQIVVPKEDAAV